MTEWFTERTPRERMLILVAGLLFALFLSWQFAVKPVIASHEKAERAQTTALRDLAIVQSGVSQLSTADDVNKKPFNRAAVIQVAKLSGVNISRVQPGQEQTLQIWFEDAQVGNVYNFLTQMSGQHACRIGRVQINRRDGGVVSAQITLHPTS